MVCVAVRVCMRAFVCMFVSYYDTKGGKTIFFFFFFFFLLLNWMFEHDCFDTCCFGCLIYMCFVIFLFAPVQHS